MAITTLDVRGEICPDPLTLAIKAMDSLAAADQLIVVVDSPMALETISRWVKNSGHKLLGVREVGAAHWEILIEKRGS